MGGRVRMFVSQWYKLTKDPKIINMIKGCSIDVQQDIDQTRPMQPLHFSAEETAQIDEHISELFRKNAIKEFEHEKGEFISNIFLCPKKDGGARVILNLKKFNLNLEKISFRMETLETIIQLVTENCWMTKIDLSDAYLTLGVKLEHQKYLRFFWKGRLLGYIVIPFGLRSAPRLFTKVLKVIVAHLRSLGFIVTFYLDDGWQKGDTYDECLLNCETTYNLLIKCGFIPNDKKSQLIPSQKIEILGHIIDSVNMCLTLPDTKTKKVVEMCEHLLSLKACRIRHLAKVIGTLISCTKVCILGQTHYRSLERDKLRGLRESHGNWEKYVSISSKSRVDLLWWIKNLPGSRAPLSHGNPSVKVSCDACGYGWSMVANNVVANGHFSPAEQVLSINTKETLAIWYGIQSHRKFLAQKHFHVESDSMTAIAYIKHFGGMQSELRDKIAHDVWQFVTNMNSWLSISHLPGVENISADVASRFLNEKTEFELDQQVFTHICKHFQFSPIIDLFGSRLNAKLKRFFSFMPDPKCEHVNAFTTKWVGKLYMFPPFVLINRCLQKIENDKCTVLAVLPMWPNQPWYSNMFRLAIRKPVLLPHPPPISLPWDPEYVHPNSERIQLIGIILSGEDSLHKGSFSLLSKYLSMDLTSPLSKHMVDGPRSGYTTVSSFTSTLYDQWPGTQ